MGVLRVRQQVDVEAKRNIAHGRDLVLGRAAGVQQARGGVLELLHGEETHALHEGPFNLSNTGREDGPVTTENHRKPARSPAPTHKPARCPPTGSDFSQCPPPGLPSPSADRQTDG